MEEWEEGEGAEGKGGRGRGSGAVGSALDIQAGPPASQLLHLPVPAPQPLPCAGPGPTSSFPTQAALPGVLLHPLSPSLRTALGLLFCPLSATVQQAGPHAEQSSQPIPAARQRDPSLGTCAGLMWPCLWAPGPQFPQAHLEGGSAPHSAPTVGFWAGSDQGSGGKCSWGSGAT